MEFLMPDQCCLFIIMASTDSLKVSTSVLNTYTHKTCNILFSIKRNRSRDRRSTIVSDGTIKFHFLLFCHTRSAIDFVIVSVFDWY